MTSRKDVAQLITRAEAQGFQVVRARRGGHWLVRKDGRLVEVLSSTPSSKWFLRRSVARLKKAGYTDR